MVSIITWSILRLMRFYHAWPTQPFYGINDWETLVKIDFVLCTIKVWSKVFLIVHLNLICVNIVFMVDKIMRGSQAKLQEKNKYWSWFTVMCLDL